MNTTPVIHFTPRSAALAAVTVLPFLLASGPLAAAPSYDTFSADPNIGTEWTQYNYYNTPTASATWNSGDQDLDLVKNGNAGAGWYRTDATRSATDPVTMTVRDFNGAAGGVTFGFVGLMITAVQQQNYISGTGDSYTIALVQKSGSLTERRFEVRRTYADGTGNYQLYTGGYFVASGDYKFDIIRDGDHYKFYANDTLLYTTTGTGADFYDTAAKDSMIYYQAVMVSSYNAIATIDNFGVPAPDAIPPALASLSPADDATAVPTYLNLVVTFNENIAFGTGNITIRESVGDAVVEAFDVTTSPKLLLSGASVTIDPTSNLAGTTGYYVQIDPDAIDDTAGNSFAGITDTTTWNFTTAAPDVTAPQLAAVDPLSPADDATGVMVNANLSVTFDEDIVFGTGNITLRTIGGGLVEAFDVETSPNLLLSGATVTIDPTSDLSAATDYYVEIASTAIEDPSGNSFAGISGSETWSFTTAEIVLFDDFSSDPNISTEWTSYGYWLSPPAGVATWNGTDQDLDLVKLTSGDAGWAVGVFRTGSTRSATDPVTMTVKDFSSSGGGSWGFLGLMISAVANPGYITTADDTYTLALVALGGTSVRYEVRRTYLDGTSNFILYQGSSFDLATSAPVTLDIVRNGDHYEFLANGNLLYTTASPAAGDTYDTAAKDSLVNYQIVMGGDRALNATVDDFGVGGVTSSPYDTWAAQIADTNQRGRGDDPDGDGFTNGEEFLFGSSPVAGNGSLVTTTTSGGNLVLRWLQRESGATYTLQQSATLEALSWTTAAQSPAQDGDQTGAPTDYDYYTVSIPVGSGKLFYRIMGVEN